MTIGGLGLVSSAVTQPDGTSFLTLLGLARVEFLGPVRQRPYRIESIRALASPPTDEPETNALVRQVRALVRRRVKAGFDLGLPAPDDAALAKKYAQAQALANASLESFGRHVAQIKSPERLADLVASTLIGDALARQLLLATPQVDVRLRHLCQLLQGAPSTPGAE